MTGAMVEEVNPDLDLKRRIANLVCDLNISVLRSLEITANQGIVTLKGNVRSFHHRQLCIHCCQRVEGVVGIIDQLQVVPVGTFD